jgi:hypothetical protein
MSAIAKQLAELAATHAKSLREVEKLNAEQRAAVDRAIGKLMGQIGLEGVSEKDGVSRVETQTGTAWAYRTDTGTVWGFTDAAGQIIAQGVIGLPVKLAG